MGNPLEQSEKLLTFERPDLGVEKRYMALRLGFGHTNRYYQMPKFQLRSSLPLTEKSLLEKQ